MMKWDKTTAGVDQESRITAYCLRGEVGGVARSFYLSPGRNTVGSLPDNDIVLPIKGVSRHHVVLTMIGGALEIEDQDTKNGTAVNGSEGRAHEVGPGDVVSFGPVSLCVEAADAEDAHLALSFQNSPFEGAAPVVSTAAAARETDFISRGPVGAGDLELVERVVVALGAGLSEALAVIAESLSLRGVAVLLWLNGGDGRLLGSVGAVEEVSDIVAAHSDTFKSRADETLAGGEWSLGRDEELLQGDKRSGAVTLGILPIGEAAAAGLLVLGNFDDRRASGPQLRLLLRLMASPEGPWEAAQGIAAPRQSLVFPEGYVVGSSAEISRLYQDLETVCDSDLSVLVLGETGVGKELLARTIHLSSPRRARPFVAVNCAAIPADLLEAEMFGIQKGVATGVEARVGSFQKADGGTLFLDEIGEMPAALQAKLLRALQEREIQPVGGSPLRVDVRLVAATNIELEDLLSNGSFRSDLYFRLAGAVLKIPSLRARRDDIPALVRGLAERFRRETGRAPRGVTARALKLLLRYPWPGNVRELEHEIRRAAFRCPPGDAIDSAMLSENLRLGIAAIGPSAAGTLDLKERLGQLERRLIVEALARTRGNRTRAARLLGISRNTLASKMELHDLDT